MKEKLRLTALACFCVFSGGRALSQLPPPVPPVNIIIDSDMSVSVDDVGDHAVMWGLVNRGEIRVLAEICSSADDFSAPAMWAIANYYGILMSSSARTKAPRQYSKTPPSASIRRRSPLSSASPAIRASTTRILYPCTA